MQQQGTETDSGQSYKEREQEMNMSSVDPIATDMLLSLPPSTALGDADRVELVGTTGEQTARVIIAFGRSIRGMPISTDVRFEQRLGAPPMILLDASKFASKHHARNVGCFVRKLCLIDGLQWGCLTNGSLILEVAYGANTGATIKCAYETVQEHPQLFTAGTSSIAEQAAITH